MHASKVYQHNEEARGSSTSERDRGTERKLINRNRQPEEGGLGHCDKAGERGRVTAMVIPRGLSGDLVLVIMAGRSKKRCISIASLSPVVLSRCFQRWRFFLLFFFLHSHGFLSQASLVQVYFAAFQLAMMFCGPGDGSKQPRFRFPRTPRELVKAGRRRPS